MRKNIYTIIIIILTVLFLISFAFAVKSQNEIKKLKIENSSLHIKVNDMIFENKELSKNKDSASEQDGKLSAKEKADLVDVEIRECMEKCDYTTACMNNCVYETGGKWEKEIDNNIKLLEKVFDIEQTELLHDSQKEWSEYKKAQQKLNDKTIGTKKGTMYTNILSVEQVDIIEKRAKELDELYHFYSNE